MSAHILFAEDDDSLRNVVADELVQAGFTVEPVEDGSVAISSLKSKTYDLVLLDIRMPGKTGMDVLDYMKTNGIRTRTIMATAVDDMAVAIQTLKLGANDFVTKPYSVTDLVECIHRVLAR
jgi:DNA-binding response OmpR family regulator